MKNILCDCIIVGVPYRYTVQMLKCTFTANYTAEPPKTKERLIL